MKLSVQTIKSVVKEIVVDPEVTFDQLREQIRELYSWPSGSKIVLVHKTKILNQTDAKLSSYPQLHDGDRIVVMKKTEPTPAPQAANQPVPTNTEPVTAAAPPTESDAPLQPERQEIPAPTIQPLFNDSQVEQLTNMGFPAEQARRALTAAFGNGDRAVEFLLNGNIPSVEDPVPAAAETAQPSTTTPVQNNVGGLQTEAFGPAAGTPSAPAANAPAVGNIGGDGSNAFLSQLSQLAAADPNVLPQLLRIIGEQNPAVLQLIEQNPQMFSQVLASIAGEAGEGGLDNPPRRVIQLTQEEHDAVNRVSATISWLFLQLCELGFTKEAALQAYLACDKNEELAANFLFDNVDMDE